MEKRSSFDIHLEKVLDEIELLLKTKNRKYGNSALEPIQIFAKQDPLAQINVRIDDKLSRIRNQQDDEDEDVEGDLLGYLILKMVAKRMMKR